MVIPIIFSPQNLYSQENAATESSLFDLRRNSVYNENLLAFSYERLLPVSDKFGFLLKGGFVIWDPLLPLIEVGVISGRSKHFFEAGIGALIANTNDEEGFDFITFRLGYRYQAPKGFLFKASAIYSPDNFILPLITAGYAF